MLCHIIQLFHIILNNIIGICLAVYELFHTNRHRSYNKTCVRNRVLFALPVQRYIVESVPGGGCGEEDVIVGGCDEDVTVGGCDEDVTVGGGDEDVSVVGCDEDVIVGGGDEDVTVGGGDEDVIVGGGDEES